MAKSKNYRFKNEFKDAIIVLPQLKKEVTAKTLTDEDAELIIKKFPQVAHNIEKIEDEQEEPKAKRETKKGDEK